MTGGILLRERANWDEDASLEWVVRGPTSMNRMRILREEEELHDSREGRARSRSRDSLP